MRVHFPLPYNGRERKFAYVEFGDEESMKAGLEKHEQVCRMLSSRSFVVVIQWLCFTLRNSMAENLKYNDLTAIPRAIIIITAAVVDVEVLVERSLVVALLLPG